jgi:cytochrome c2
MYYRLLMLAAFAYCSSALGADATAGKDFFKQQCSVCHTAEPNDNGGTQGPSLVGVYGRRAAADTTFSYTKALKDSKLTWDAASLDRFLAAPGHTVPGTAMAVAVSDKAQRANLIEYFKSAPTVATNTTSAPATPAQSSGASEREESDWKNDAPGRRHKIDLNALPAPFSLRDKVLVPDVPYHAHSAAPGLVFYTATQGQFAFPAEYVGDGFATFHGSWNRGFRTGHKVVRVRMKDGVPTGEYEDFVTGFIINDGDAWGRPVSAAVLGDGSLLFSDDGATVIYRVAYEKKSARRN